MSLPGIQYQTGTTIPGGGGTSATVDPYAGTSYAGRGTVDTGQTVDEDGNSTALSNVNSAGVAQNPPISVSGLQTSPTPLPVVNPNPTPIYPVSTLTSVSTPALSETPSQTSESDLSQRLQALNDQLIGKSAYQTQEDAAQGIPDMTKSINDLSSRQTALSNEALAIPQQIQLDATGRGETTGGLAPIQTAALRNNAIQALGISTLLNTAKGNLTLAQSLSDKAVAQKYDPIQEQITAAQANLQLIANDPETTIEEKNQAQAQLDSVNAQQAKLAQNKTDMSTIQSWASAALSNGATPYQAQQILSIAQSDTPDINAAFKLYAPFATNPNATAKAVADLNLTRAQTASANATANKTNAETAQLNNPVNSTTGLVAGTTGSPSIDATTQGYSSIAVPGAGGLTQAAIDQAALQFALTGKMPSIGLGSTGAGGQRKTAIQNRAGELNSGGNIAANAATLKALSSSLTTQTSYANTISRNLQSAQNGLQQIVDAFSGKGIDTSTTTLANVMANAAKYQFSPDDIASFKSGLQEVSNEYSQVFSRNGTQTNQTRQTAQDILDGNLSISALRSISSELQSQGAIAVKSANDQVQSIQNKINTIITPNSSQGSSKPKGDQTDSQFVESTLTALGTHYSDVISKIPAGKKGVVDNATGNIGYIDPGEYDPAKYTSL